MAVTTTQAASPTSTQAKARDPWLPLIVIAMGQALISFNVSALLVSMGGMIESFRTPPTTVATAVVLYSLGVSGFILLGGKLGRRVGSRRMFQITVLGFGAEIGRAHV